MGKLIPVIVPKTKEDLQYLAELDAKGELISADSDSACWGVTDKPKHSDIANADTDISDAELHAIHDLVQAQIDKHGLPTEEEIHREIEALNEQSEH